MIPISLTLSGIYSYQQPQSIDFTRLASSSIFGIFGMVGSGKSTILEAISYALYGETERLNMRENRGYNMMNLKSHELLIDFIFQAGADNTEYRFKVSGKRNKNHFDRINTFDRTAYRKEKGEWMPIDVNSSEEIIGLSYDNFRRTIIIPQNKFQEFLQLGDKDRTQMMKELFNLEKFELFHKVTALERKNNQEKMVLSDRLKQIGEVDPAQIVSLKEEQMHVQQALLESTRSLTDKQYIETAFTQLKELFVKINRQQDALRQLEARENEFNLLEARIREYEYCQLNFKALLNDQRRNSEEIARQTAVLRQQGEQVTKINTQLKGEETAFEQTREAYHNRENLRKKAEELAKVVEIISLDERVAELDARIANGELFHSKALSTVSSLQSEQTTITESLKKLSASLPDMAVLAAIREWFTINNSLLEQRRSILEDTIRLQSKIGQIQLHREQVLAAEVRRLLPVMAGEESTTKDVMPALIQSKVDMEEQIGKIDHEITHLAIQSKLEEYAAALHDDEPCPLCGSLEHPALIDATQVNQAVSQLRKTRQQLQADIRLIEHTQQQMDSFAAQAAAQEENLMIARRKVDELERRLDIHQAGFVWQQFDKTNEDGLKQAFSEADFLKKRIEKEEKLLEENKRILEEENTNEAKYRSAIEKFNLKREAVSAEKNTLLKQLSTLNIHEYVHEKSSVLQVMSQDLLSQYNRVTEEYQKSEGRLSSLRIELGKLHGTIEANEKTLSGLRDHAETLHHQITTQLAASSYSNLDAVAAILQSSMDTEQEKRRLTDFRQRLHSCQEQHRVLLEQAKDKNYDELTHTELLAEISRLKAEQNNQHKELARLESKIDALQKDLDSQEQLRKQVEKLQLRSDDISTLKKLFTASGFVNYVSSVYLQNLCNAANERFYKLTRQKLQLEITDKNDFQIRDFLNNGQVRSVKTLSGGQTFQAALSLALALADNIQKLTHSSQNFFFLDEGFGSLDKDSLQTVFDTLKALRKENRIVGVISHVEEMQQEIDTYLKIVNDEATGSQISTSWS